MEKPLVTEEQGNTWVQEGSTTVNLTAEVGDKIRAHETCSGANAMMGLHLDLAQQILAIPTIKAALELYAKTQVPSGEMAGREAF